MTFEPIWGAIIAWYLFLAGLGGGAFVTSAFLGWRHPEAVSMRKIGHLVAPIVVIIGLCLLMFDAKAGLMNPLRFFGLLGNFSSIMAWGVVILIAFMAVSVIAVVVMLAIQWVGLLLINAMLILPAAAARNVARSMRSYLALALIFSLFSGLLGLCLSYLNAVAAGPTIVLVSAALFFGTYLMGRRAG